MFRHSNRRKVQFGAFVKKSGNCEEPSTLHNDLKSRGVRLFISHLGAESDLFEHFSNESDWHSSVCCHISNVDPDSLDEAVSIDSIKRLERELANAHYLGVPLVTIELRRKSSPKLANVLMKWIQTPCVTFRLWIMLPTIATELLDADDSDEVWSIWAEFRRLCHNSRKLCVGLRICLDSDDEFSDCFCVNRWKGEPIESIWIDEGIFTDHQTYSNSVCNVNLSDYHQNLFLKFAEIVPFFVLIHQMNNRSMDFFSAKLTMLNRLVNNESKIFQSVPDEALDVPQIPLQPLCHNLSSVVYQTFESDAAKYEKYEEAMFLAIGDVLKSSNSTIENEELVINVFILGAGRGPLVDRLFQVESRLKQQDKFTHWSIKKWAVEKNPGAFAALSFKNSQRWNNSVSLLECDMRELPKKLQNGPAPDVIVSELLGSFGDNELSPECLDGLSGFLKESTISIPRSYRNYLAPIHSVVIQQNLQCLENDPAALQPETGRDSSRNIQVTDRLYVVCMQNVGLLANPLSCFEFSHPNRDAMPNSRNVVLQFKIPAHCEVSGFAGFFEACLYDDVWIGILPERHTPKMFSWSPAFLPIRRPIECSKLTILELFLSRNVDNEGVWYEWKLNSYTQDSIKPENAIQNNVIQNSNGSSQYLRLQCG